MVSPLDDDDKEKSEETEIIFEDNDDESETGIFQQVWNEKPAVSPRATRRSSLKDSARNLLENVKQGRRDSSPLKQQKTPETIKIFLLLLEPTLKIFELIQLHYNPSITKIKDIMEMIPQNATENILKTQNYMGLTRPKRKGHAYTNLRLYASSSHHTQKSIGVSPGEVLVALPQGHTRERIVKLAKQVLANPRIKALVQKPNHLAEPNTSSDNHSVSSSITPTVVSVSTLPSNTNKYQSHTDESTKEAVISLESYLRGVQYQSGDCLDESNSVTESYTSWTQSFDVSIRRHACASNRRSIPRYYYFRAAVVLAALAMAWYFVDPQGYAVRGTRGHQDDSVAMVSTIVIFYLLRKTQKFFQKSHVDYSKCVFLQVVSSALERLNQRKG